MILDNQRKLVRITWKDAVIFDSAKLPNQLIPMETRGLLVQEKENYFLIAKPKTKKIDQNTPQRFLMSWTKNVFGKKPTFFYIPKGMVVKIDFL